MMACLSLCAIGPVPARPVVITLFKVTGIRGHRGASSYLSGLLVLYHLMLTRQMRGGRFSRSSNTQLPKQGSTPLTLALNAI